jgi:DNA repair protein RecN (Recombination protein N)
MLRSLRIKNLALIDDLTWELHEGFNILTGETGAGKSILIDGLNLLLGVRADKTLIRSGESQCSVEAEITISETKTAQLNGILEEIGAELCEEGCLILKRSLTTTGSNRQFVNGSPTTLQSLQQVGDLLVDVHGPHDHQSLLSTDQQLQMVDAYGKLSSQKGEFAAVYRQVKKIQESLDSLQMSEREKNEKIERLRHLVDEIRQANLKPGEDLEVDQNYRLASNSRQLIESANYIHGLLSEEEQSVFLQLAQVERRLQAWEKVDSGMSSIAEPFRSAVLLLQTFDGEIQSFAEKIDLDAAQMLTLENRVNLIQSLKRKYGQTLDEILTLADESESQLKTLESRDEEIQKLQAEKSKLEKESQKLALKLSEARRKVSIPLAEKIQKELRGLGFAKAHFQIDLVQGEITATGLDKIEFIFSPNQGETPRPLRAIASSGEMARVMLAVKTTLAEVDEVPILVFDEVDANVGGETATQVGKKLRGLGKSHQVLCITHLPQVAAQGEAHYKVEKSVEKGRTLTKLENLSGKNRIQEIARMLGGQNDKTLALAKALIEE